MTHQSNFYVFMFVSALSIAFSTILSDETLVSIKIVVLSGYGIYHKQSDTVFALVKI